MASVKSAPVKDGKKGAKAEPKKDKIKGGKMAAKKAGWK